MNSLKRARYISAPVATTSTVNYKTVNRVITISGREFIQDAVASAIAAGSLFSATSRLLRPTDSQIFSWLAGIARKFEEFKFLSLKFIYEPQVSSTTAGQVGMYFDGDPTHLAPANWNNFINTGANSHGAVWARQMFVVPKWLYASRSSYYTLSEFGDTNQQVGVPNNQPSDPMEYYPGLFGVVHEGIPSGVAPGQVTLGKVYLEYTVQLKTQNVDGVNITNTIGNVIGTEEAVNSGTGYFRKMVTPFPGAGAYIFGGPIVYNREQAGNAYFRRITLNGVIHEQAVQDLNLMYVTRCTGAGPVTVTPQGSIVNNGVVVGYAALNDTTTYTTNGGFVKPIDADELPANDVTFAFQIRLQSGMLFRVLTDTAVLYCHHIFSPWAYPIQG